MISIKKFIVVVRFIVTNIVPQSLHRPPMKSHHQQPHFNYELPQQYPNPSPMISSYPDAPRVRKKLTKSSKLAIGLGTISALGSAGVAATSAAVQYGNFNPSFGDLFFSDPTTLLVSSFATPSFMLGATLGYSSAIKKAKE